MNGTKLTGVIGHVNKTPKEEFIELVNALAEDSAKQLGLPYINAEIITETVEKIMHTERMQKIYNDLAELEQIKTAELKMAETTPLKAFKNMLQEIEITGSCFDDYANIVEAYLKEYEAIKSAEPTKALECFKRIMEKYGNDNNLEGTYNDFLTIKQALMSKSNAERCLKIIFEKNVNILLLKLAENVDEYNKRIVSNNGKLTQEEFELLKECLK